MQCSFDGCTRAVRAHGLCWSHDRQRRAGKQLTPIRTWERQTERDDQGRKKCRICKQYLTVDLFGKSSRNPDGVNSICKQCATDKHRLEQFGITPADYDALLDKQGGGCAICAGQCSSGRKLAIDHDHTCCPGSMTCGKCIRGLLCGSCNQGIGKFRDSPVLLARAAEYLSVD